MGVKKFITAFVSTIPASLDAMRNTCAGAAIDMNQFVHQALNKLIEEVSAGTESVDGAEVYRLSQEAMQKITDHTDLLTLYAEKCKGVLDMVLAELKEIKGLRDLYITMDGTPCYGKIQNQIERRRHPRHIVSVTKDSRGTETKTLLLSSSHILPGTPLMNVFTKVLRERIDAFLVANPTVAIVLSLTDIPGEGEHKALDYLNASPYTSFNRDEEQRLSRSFLIWSNDSDVIISLIHRSVINVYVMSENSRGGEISLNCVELRAVRERLCSEHREVLNAPLLIAFAGNDYLPEMMDSADLREAYARLRHACVATDSRPAICLTKEVKPPNAVDIMLQTRENNEVMPGDVAQSEVVTESSSKARATGPGRPMYGYPRLIDFVALRTLLRSMAEQEIKLYYSDSGLRSGPYSATRLLLFKDDVNTFLTNPVAFKRKYYKAVHNELLRVDASPINPKDPLEPTDSELYDLEMILAVNYLRTYCWYYYYQSGMHTGGSMDNAYYHYSFAPLYSSLYIVLDRADPNKLIHFDPAVNPEIYPVPRDDGYFERLQVFTDLHHFLVLQSDDYELLLKVTGTQKSPFENNDLVATRSMVLRSAIVVDRYNKPIELSKRVSIALLLEKYRNYVRLANTPLTRIGREQERAVVKNISDRYRLRGMADM